MTAREAKRLSSICLCSHVDHTRDKRFRPCDDEGCDCGDFIPKIMIKTGTPDMPPNWSRARQRRMLKAVTITLRYIRTDQYTWENAAGEMRNGNNHTWKDPKSGKVYPVSHQYVSQILAKGMAYLMDHERLINMESGEPVMRGPKKRSAA